MQEAVPTIYAPPTTPVRLSLYARCIALVVAAACATLVVTALRLTPAPEGVGTHTDLGYLACNMLLKSGVPCPTCGMTTSFAWFFRGNLVASAYIQPAGFVAALLVAMILPLALYEAITARPIHRLLKYLPGKMLLLTGAGIFLLGWGWKILIRIAGMDGWG